MQPPVPYRLSYPETRGIRTPNDDDDDDDDDYLIMLFFCLQILVRASDRFNDTKGQVSTARVLVNVPRDQNPPRFSGIPYLARITENTAVNTSIFTVRADDQDRQVCNMRFDKFNIVLIQL